MSIGNGPAGVGGTETDSGAAETAKQEAAAVTGTAVDAAKDVAHTAKDEAASVASEAKTQLKDLYSQGRTELSGQAAQQQERLAGGLKAAGDELGAMARNSDGSGIATDLVQQVSTRLTDVASWLGERDPAALLDEVKRFARRRPLAFIAGAAVVGVVAGRLVRAMASHDEASTSAGSLAPAPSGASGVPASAPATPVAGDEPSYIDPLAQSASRDLPASATPLYDESAGAIGGAEGRGTDERRDTF
ncbi:hypothetical protein ACH0CG_05920 [Microbacterium sp. 179-I 1D1 NHS]|uniref:hypothetical protein n=1 Tax=Microbacterium sp. 179-I 1D1 NHS TaxID=3374298 RepID=UPI003879A071